MLGLYVLAITSLGKRGGEEGKEERRKKGRR